MDIDSPTQAEQRYEHFVSSTLSQRAVWALKKDGGFACWQDDEADTPIVPLWSEHEAAAACAALTFPGYIPNRVELESLVAGLLPDFETRGVWVGTNLTAQMTGIDVPAGKLRRRLETNLPSQGRNAP